LTSTDVLTVEHAIVDRITQRAEAKGITIVEGAAGAGKTTRLAATRKAFEDAGRRMLLVTPTRKAAQVAAPEVGAAAHSVAWLLHQHGFRWNDDGRWSRVHSAPLPSARLRRGDLLVVDEAGMLDQDTGRALLRLADEVGATVMLVGDRHQLPAVGRGGVLDLAIRYAPDRVTQLEATGSPPPQRPRHRRRQPGDLDRPCLRRRQPHRARQRGQASPAAELCACSRRARLRHHRVRCTRLDRTDLSRPHW